MLATLGVVYGDIGTSPLYALRECFYGSHSVTPTHDNVLGVLSLIIYSLVLVISIKYIVLVLRADNHGEGGILALTALIPPRPESSRRIPVLVLLGLFGATVFAWLVAQATFGGINTVVTFDHISYPLVRGWQLLLPDYRARTPRDWVLHGAWLAAVAACVLATWRPHFAMKQRFTMTLKETS